MSPHIRMAAPRDGVGVVERLLQGCSGRHVSQSASEAGARRCQSVAVARRPCGDVTPPPYKRRWVGAHGGIAGVAKALPSAGGSGARRRVVGGTRAGRLEHGGRRWRGRRAEPAFIADAAAAVAHATYRRGHMLLREIALDSANVGDDVRSVQASSADVIATREFLRLLRMRLETQDALERARQVARFTAQPAMISPLSEVLGEHDTAADAQSPGDRREDPQVDVGSASAGAADGDPRQRLSLPPAQIDGIFATVETLFKAVQRHYGEAYLREHLCTAAGGGMMGQERHKLSRHAERILIEHYEQHGAYPSAIEKERLVRATGLSRKQVTYWFGNRRMREKNGRLRRRKPPRDRPEGAASVS
eukprot:ctg_210.g163